MSISGGWKTKASRRQDRCSRILEILIEQVLDSAEFREENAADDKRKYKGSKMGAIDPESPRDGRCPGCLEPVFFRSALEK